MTAPKLRFQEFDGNWESNQLGKIIGISSASRVFKEQWQDSGVPFFRTSDVVSIFKNKENEKAYISLELFEELAKKSGKINKDDLLVTGGGTIGIPYLVQNDQPLYFKDADLLWMKSSGIIKGSFLYNFLISPKFREYLNSISHTGTISHFTIEQAKATPFSFPSKEEQAKIASFLSTVDEKISQLSQKLHLLEQYKQGMVQKLLNQKKRFKADDGSEFDHWKKTKLDDLLIKHEEKTDRNNQYPVLTSSRNGIFFQKDYFAGQDVASSDTTGYNVVPLGYFTYRHMSDDLVFKFNINTLCEKGIVSTLYPVFTVKETHLNKYFLQIVLNEGNEFKNFAIMQKQGGSRTYMYYSKLKELILNIPTLPEQTKIANFLSSIDQKIDVVSEQLEQAKLWKKGLLQQMFV